MKYYYYSFENIHELQIKNLMMYYYVENIYKVLFVIKTYCFFDLEKKLTKKISNISIFFSDILNIIIIFYNKKNIIDTMYF